MFLSTVSKKLLAIWKTSPSMSNIPTGTLTKVSSLRKPLSKSSTLYSGIPSSSRAAISSLSVNLGSGLLS